MKKNVLSKVTAVIVSGIICFGCTSVYASNHNASQTIASGKSISPYFIVIISCWNNLTLNSGGRLTCEGETQVQDEYIAGITIELQQDDDGWTTIKTWSGLDWDNIYLSKDWYVLSGYSYRLKLTHKALDSDGNIIETFIKYSETVTY